VRVGIDVVETSRIAKSANRPNFLERVFSTEELALCTAKRNPIESLSARFCVKEAFGKALGTGVRGFSLCEVSTLNDPLGCPYVVLTGNAKELARGYAVSVSVSHTKEYATAVVVLTPTTQG
jgi:holo-[acyl-carrier protein] synthase